MFTISRTSRAVALLMGGLACAGVALAQTATDDPKKQRVEITGSNVKRADTETVAPVTIITREQIEKSGRATIAEVLRELPINSAQSFSETSLNSFASGGTGISLRGLGGLGTLVLFNGRRVANYPFAANLDETFVDLNQIPASVVERVEILKDGASAIYGSDAIGGVVNVIFRRDFRGLEIAGRGSMGVARKETEGAGAAITFGMGDLGADRFNIFGVADLYKRSGMARSEFPLTVSNDFSRYWSGEDQRGSTGGTWRAATGPAAIRNTRFPVPNCDTELIPASRLSPTLTGTSCVGDFGPRVTSLVPDQERASAYVKASFDFSANLRAFAELGFSEVKSTVLQDYNYLTAGATRFAPVSSGGETFLIPQSVRYLIPAGQAGNPTGQFAELLYPSFDFGIRTQHIKSTNTKFAAGLQGTHFGWDWDTAVAGAKAEASSDYRNLMSYSGLLNSGSVGPGVGLIFVNGANTGKQGAFIPFGATNSAAVVDAITTNTLRKSSAEVLTADFKATRELFQLPGGPAGMAVGVDFRTEKLKDTPDAQLLAGDILNFGYTGTTGKRDVWAAYAEAILPLTKQLEVQAAVRYDNYSDAGTATSPKLGAKFKVADGFLVRGNWGKGFRAPSLPQISKSDSTAFSSYFDWAACINSNYAPACQGINTGTGSSVGVIFRSNPNLKPEISETYTLGFVFSPTADTSVAIDAYKIRWSNLVGSQDIQNILDDEIELGRSRPDVLIRDPSNGALIGAVNQFINFGLIKTSGVDIDFRHRFATPWGRMGVQTEFTYVGTFKISNALPDYLGGGLELSEFAGRNISTQSAFPRMRGNLRFEWEWKDFTFGARANVVGPYDQSQATRSGQPIRNFRGEARHTEIPEHVTFDLSMQYRLGKNTRIFASLINAGDKMPPFDPRMSSYGYAVDQYSTQGRTLSMSFRHTF